MSNSYDYPADPINLFDLTGQMQDCGNCSSGSVITTCSGRRCIVAVFHAPIPQRPSSKPPTRAQYDSMAVRTGQWSSAMGAAGVVFAGTPLMGLTPVLATGSLIMSIASTATVCQQQLGDENSCAQSIMMTVWGASTLGAGHLLKKLAPSVGGLKAEFYTGSMQGSAIDLGFTFVP